MQPKKLIKFFLMISILLLLVLTIVLEKYYLWLSFGLVGASIVLLILRFESRKVEPRELVLLAVLAAIAAVGRVAFASIPSVQPTSFVIMISGFVFGAESGFLIGAVAALASNMVLGQGPWTPWQMIAWGLVGYTAGLLSKNKLMDKKIGKILFGIVWGYVFGLITNLWGFLSFTQSGAPVELQAILSYFAASFLYDTNHAVSNVFFLLVFGDSWVKILKRFKNKYGLMKEG